MVNLKEKILSIFSDSEITATETWTVFEAVVHQIDKSIDNLELKTVLKQIPDRDTWELSFLADSDEVASLSNTGDSNIIGFVDEISDHNSIMADHSSSTAVSIRISKEKGNTCSIYDLNIFIKRLDKLAKINLFKNFSEILKKYSYLKFEVFHEIESFNSKNIYFYGTGNDVQNKSIEIDERENLISIMKEHCHSFNNDFMAIIPEDFQLINHTSNKLVSSFFNKAKIFISISYLFNILSLKTDDSIEFKLNGYNCIENTITYDELQEDKAQIFYDIYKWVYSSGGHVTDKIGLARNIITIHLNNNNIFSIEEKVLPSIKSSYDIYLKKNVVKYIEVKNQISQALFDLSKQVNGIVNSLADSFKNNIFAFITFFITIIVINSINSGKFENIFTRDITYISGALIFLSILYLFYSIWEINSNKKRLENYYGNLKLQYNDLLDEKDIETIFSNDSFDDDVEFIKEKRFWLIVLWICVLIIFSVTIFLLSDINLKQSFLLVQNIFK